jgi:cytochrome bd-type quinol oxidase subunit 2
MLGAVLATRFPHSAATLFSASMASTFVLLGLALRPSSSKP